MYLSHTSPSCSMTRFVYCNNAVCLGGKVSIDLALVAEMCFLAESTLFYVHVLSYSRTMHNSITFIHSLLNVTGLVDSAAKTCLTSWNEFQMFNAVFFRWPVNVETVSQHMKIWNTWSSPAFASQSNAVMSWVGMYHRCFLVPKETQSYVSWMSAHLETSYIVVQVVYSNCS